MIENYIVYLNFLDRKLKKFFDKQKPYIFCKKGCALCCKNAQFPYSKLEIVYLMAGAQKLTDEQLNIITDNISKIKQAKSEFKGEVFMYDCPFLIDNVCSVYEYRGVVCRTFGLTSVGDNGKMKIPFCCFEGYNYSNVMEDNGNKISTEKFKKLGVKEEPVAFHIGYDFLTGADFEKWFNVKFGEKKSLIDWFD